MNKLYIMWRYNYPEDWVLIYANTIEEIIKQYCEATDKKPFDEDEFYANYVCDEINAVGDRKIKEIVFESE